MSYDYSSESQRLELPNPYRLQNRLLWLCAMLLLAAGVTCLWWAREALQAQSLRLVAAPLVAGLLIVGSGLACAAQAATRLRFFFGRGRPVSLVPELAPGTTGGSAAANQVKDLLRQGALTYPEPQGAIEGVLYHWVPHLITAPLIVQQLASRNIFNLAAFLATGISFLFSWWVFGTEQTRAWIGVLYFLFGAFFLLRPLLSNSRARLSSASLIGLIASAILAPVVVGLLGPQLPRLGGFSLNAQTFVMLLAALVACGLGMAAVLGQIDHANPSTHTSVDQQRLSMNAPPAMLIDELDRLLQSEWTERIPNRRYARIEPVTPAGTPSGSFAGELFEETQPLPVSGTVAPTFLSALGSRRHRALLLLDIYATVLLVVAAGFALYFVHRFDALLGWEQNRFSLMGISLILGLVASFCFKEAGRLWGRFNFESTLVWVEVMGNYQTSRIGTGNQFSSRMNTQNDVVRTESMTLRVWRARIESVVFGKDGRRQITAMFSTDQEARTLSERLMAFARGQSVLVAAASGEDQARLAALNQGERILQSSNAGPSAAEISHQLQAAAALGAPPAAGLPAPGAAAFCPACGHKVAAPARFCSNCGQALPSAG